MAKLVLKLNHAVQTEVPLLNATVNIGRLPDNTLQIDDSGVSSRHCRVVAEGGNYFVEDTDSKNGTFVNRQRVTRVQLIDGDELTFGKHTVTFVDVDEAPTGTRKRRAHVSRTPETIMFEAGKGEELLDSIKTDMASGIMRSPLAPAAPAPIGTLTVLRGRTDKPQYVLARRTFLIGKSDTAGIRLKGFFAPREAAIISRSEGRYFVAPAENSAKVKINQARLEAPQELNEGDVLEVGWVKMTFSYPE